MHSSWPRVKISSATKKISASKKLLSCQFFCAHRHQPPHKHNAATRAGIFSPVKNLELVCCLVRFQFNLFCATSGLGLLRNCVKNAVQRNPLTKEFPNACIIYGAGHLSGKSVSIFFILGIRRPIFLHLLTGFFSKSAQFWLPKKRTLDARN